MTRRPNRVLAIVVGVIALVAVVAAVLATTRAVPKYDRGTPQGVVQAYLSAVIDGDHQQAAKLLAEGSPCRVEDLDQAYVPDEVRVVLRDTEVDGDTAQVVVDVVMSSGDLLDGSEHAEKHTFRLTRATGAWLVTGTPWPMYECSKER